MKVRVLMTVFMVLLLAGVSNAGSFTLKSSEISDQLSSNQVFSGFGCTGKNQSPSLQWENVPAGTKSFAVTVYDPDAPTGSGWWHWVIYNIPVKTHELKTDAGNIQSNLAPEGSVQGLTDFGQKGFGGACPPKGDKPHRYIFTVYALNVDHLDLPPGATPGMVGYFLNQNAITKATLMSHYSR